jgi:hypothetical protein
VKIQAIVTEIDQARWDYVQRAVLLEYQFPERATRVCVTFARGEEERHAEMPLAAFSALMMGLSLAGITEVLQAAVEQINTQMQRKPDQGEQLLAEMSERSWSGVCEVPACGCSGQAHA